MKILGIDPGFGITGYGLIEAHANQSRGLQLVEAGILNSQKNRAFSERLCEIHRYLTELLKEFSPEVMAIEDTYSVQAFPKTAIFIGCVRGVVLLAAGQNSIPVFHYYPRQVKKALVGNGDATKSQIQKMVQSNLCLKETPRPDDVADALAVAICHAQRLR